MKSARELAEMLWSELPMGATVLLDREAWIDGVEVLFKAHARDTLNAAGERLMEAVRGRRKEKY